MSCILILLGVNLLLTIYLFYREILHHKKNKFFSLYFAYSITVKNEISFLTVSSLMWKLPLMYDLAFDLFVF